MLAPATILASNGGQYKPAGIPAIDWSHPLAQGLVFLGYDIGGQIIDLVGGRKGTLGGATPVTNTRYGQSLKISTNAVTFASDAAIRAASLAPFSVALAYVPNVGYQNNDIPFARLANNNSSQPFINWGFQVKPINGVYAIIDSGGAYTQVGTQSYPTVGSFASIVEVVPNSSTARLYMNGVQQGSDATGLTVQSANANDGIIFGTIAGGTNSQNAFYGAVWGNRALTTAETLQLYLNPYSFLIYPKQRIYQTAQVPSSSFQAAWAVPSNFLNAGQAS